MDLKVLSRILLGFGIAALVSAMVTLVVQPGAVQVYGVIGGVGLACVIGFFATNRDALSRAAAGRGTTFYAVSAVSGLVLVGALAAINYAAVEKKQSWDVTKDGLFTLSQQSVDTVKNLKEEVRVVAYYGSADPQLAPLEALITRYREHGDKLVFEVVDPMTNPQRVKEDGITEAGPRVVVKRGGATAKVQEPTEEGITNALVKVQNRIAKKVYFTVGHGELDTTDTQGDSGYGRISALLSDDGLSVSTVSLATGEVPADAAAVVIAGPRLPFLEGEIAQLKAYMEKGGRLLVALEPKIRDSGLEDLLGARGIIVEDALIVDPLSKIMGGGDAIPVVQQYAEHPITQRFQLATLFPTARPITAGGDAAPRPLVLATTNPSAWAETNIGEDGRVEFDEGEKRGALGVAAMVVQKVGDNEARYVVFGDSDFANNRFSQLGGNTDFFLNAMNWLASQEDRITIRPKQRAASQIILTADQGLFLQVFALNVLPMLILAAGLSVWLVRRAK